MSDNVLQQIKDLQLTDKTAAENLLLPFLREAFPLDVQSVELRPLAVSLNSFNGFMTLADGKRLFFKTHTEPDNVIGEYYNAAMLAQAGYPVIQPLYSSTEAGKQLLIYEVIDDPSVFDVAWALENQNTDTLRKLTNTETKHEPDNPLDRLSVNFRMLQEAQFKADKQLLQIYLNTLEWQSAEDAAKAPIHQLFFHRLVGGRLERFYGALMRNQDEDVAINLLGGRNISMREVRMMRWNINSQSYEDRLDDLINRSIRLLNPLQAGPSIIGHGDAHNGNVFLKQQDVSLLYFDPAFAGRHSPLLDLVKPLFHNVFAMWMYFPHEKSRRMDFVSDRKDGVWYVAHDYFRHMDGGNGLPPVRAIFLRSKVEQVLTPILRELKRRNWLRDDWRAYLKVALFCCPFLTMNLTDSDKFSPEIALLGLTMAVEMGAESKGERSLVDNILDEVERAL